MSGATFSTRRSFIRTAGTALSVPLAAAAASTRLSAGDAGDPLEARLARLEDAEAIRALNQEYVRGVNARDHQRVAALFADSQDVGAGVSRPVSAAALNAQIRELAWDGFGERDRIDVAPDRRTAAAVVHCAAELEYALDPECPLVEMARQQGGGFVRRTDVGVFEFAYVRRDGTWKIERSAYRAI